MIVDVYTMLVRSMTVNGSADARSENQNGNEEGPAVL